MKRQLKKRPGAKPEIAIEDIIAIRESLDLTQAEAGKLLGGGPNAYAKYEAGTVKPSAAAANLLRLLYDHPEMLDVLRDAEPAAMPAQASAPSPFEVNGEDIGSLHRDDLPGLLRRLLGAEAETHDLPVDGIRVADNINAPDGGEDGRVTWEDGPERTRFLPARRCQFQLKSGSMTPAKAGKEILGKDGAVKDMVRKFLEDDGHYLMLCTRPYTQQAIEKREESVRAALRGAGLGKKACDRVRFRDAGQIADWANFHPAVALWVRERTERGVPGPFRTWPHWAGRAEHAAPWIEDERLPEFRARLLERAARPGGIARVVGPYGIGKSRLTLQALAPDGANWSISYLVLYADEYEASPASVSEVIRRWVDAGKHAIAVVNHCTPERHRILENMVLREGNRLSLITIGDEAAGTAAEAALIKVRKPTPTVIEAIVEHKVPRLPPEDRRRLVKFAAGLPGIAVLAARAWRTRDERKSSSLAQAADDELVDDIVLGRRPREPGRRRRAAALLAAFGLIDPRPESGGEIGKIAELGRNLTGDDLHAAMQDLESRDVIHRRGGLMLFPASPIAMNLAARQWREWQPSKWDGILGGDIGPGLSLRAAQRLSLLNDTDIAREVVAHVCREGGPMERMLHGPLSSRAAMLTLLAETNPGATTGLLERHLDQREDEPEIRCSVEIALALSKIAFRPDTFEDGARLLLQLAARSERGMNEIIRNPFTDLFPFCEGSTAATGRARLEFLDERIEADRPDERAVIVDALAEGLETERFHRFVGIESQGSRPALEPWFPDTHGTAREYLSGCAERLARFAERDDEAGRDARIGLNQRLRGLLRYGLIDAVENAAVQVREAAGGWPEAIDSLGQFLKYDARKEEPELIGRVRKLIEQLQPQELESRGRFLVTSMPWDYPSDQELTHRERHEIQTREIEELAAEFARQPETLQRFLPEISRGRQRMAVEFGRALAGDGDAPPGWLEPIAAAAAGAPDGERNFRLLCGYLDGIHAKHPDAVRDFKRQAAQSAELAPALPAVCRFCGIEPADIRLALGALEAGRLDPWHLGRQWEHFGEFAGIPAAEVAPLFDRLLDGDAEAFRVGVFLLEEYTREEPGKLASLRLQIRRMAKNAIHHGADTDARMLADRFERTMAKVLERGWQDPDARAAALELAKALAGTDRWDGGRLVRPVLPRLLTDFTEIVWPVLGQAIVLDPDQGKRFEQALGSPFSFAEVKNPPILHLPEETLFGWCREHPRRAPAFAASVVPVLTTYETSASDRKLHPVLSRLLDEFGERQDVLDNIRSNIRNYAWSGPPAEYYELFLEPLDALRSRHPKKPVRLWAKETLRWLRERAKSSREEDEEREAFCEI